MGLCVVAAAHGPTEYKMVVLGRECSSQKHRLNWWLPCVKANEAHTERLALASQSVSHKGSSSSSGTNHNNNNRTTDSEPTTVQLIVIVSLPPAISSSSSSSRSGNG